MFGDRDSNKGGLMSVTRCFVFTEFFPLCDVNLFCDPPLSEIISEGSGFER